MTPGPLITSVMGARLSLFFFLPSLHSSFARGERDILKRKVLGLIVHKMRQVKDTQRQLLRFRFVISDSRWREVQSARESDDLHNEAVHKITNSHAIASFGRTKTCADPLGTDVTRSWRSRSARTGCPPPLTNMSVDQVAVQRQRALRQQSVPQ